VLLFPPPSSSQYLSAISRAANDQDNNLPLCKSSLPFKFPSLGGTSFTGARSCVGARHPHNSETIRNFPGAWHLHNLRYGILGELNMDRIINFLHNTAI